DKVTILETMSAQDFLDFRDLLRPASGFQSMQFKVLETLLGLKVEERHGQEYFTSQLKSEDAKSIYTLAKETTLLQLVNNWLERMPYFSNTYWTEGASFFDQYRTAYSNSLGEGEKQNMQAFDELFINEPSTPRKLSKEARKAALFIMLYRDYPILQNPYRIMNLLLDIDELLATWRWRHMNMVHRMIGNRSGTGGSTGKGYLREAAMKHYIFQEFAELTSFLVERRNFPQLPAALESKLGFTR
ncbi:MAG: tryptophan 2,3-dioxygenase family protein, partial [Bacteroidota bacterium]